MSGRRHGLWEVAQQCETINPIIENNLFVVPKSYCILAKSGVSSLLDRYDTRLVDEVRLSLLGEPELDVVDAEAWNILAGSGGGGGAASTIREVVFLSIVLSGGLLLLNESGTVMNDSQRSPVTLGWDVAEKIKGGSTSRPEVDSWGETRRVAGAEVEPPLGESLQTKEKSS